MPSQPAAGGHVYTAVRQKSDALFLQKAALHFGPAEGIAGAGAAVLKHHAVAGNDAGLGVAVQGKPHAARAGGLPANCATWP